jgi:hypothetical protein
MADRTARIQELRDSIHNLGLLINGHQSELDTLLREEVGVEEGDVVLARISNARTKSPEWVEALVTRVTFWDDGTLWNIKVSPKTKSGAWSKSGRSVGKSEWKKAAKLSHAEPAASEVARAV